MQESFIQPLVERINDFEFVWNNDDDAETTENASKRVISFYALVVIPLFNSSGNDKIDNQMKIDLIGNNEFMLKMPDVIRKFLFVMLASGNQQINDELLISMS